MKEILVSQPEYVQNFSCIGSACEDHCCKQWNITLDKTTYNKYLKSEIPGVKNIAIENITKTKKSHSSWALVKLNEQGNCSYLESDNLCKIHKTMGPEALSGTCSLYPRQYVLYKKERIESLSLSCPEATRKVLLTDTALNINNFNVTQTNFNSRPDIGIEGKIINLFCANLLMVPQDRIEQNLYAMTCFLLYAEKQTGTLDDKFAALENVYSALIQQLQNGETLKAMANINSEPFFELALIYGIRGAIDEAKGCRGSATLGKFTDRLNQHFATTHTQQELDANLAKLKQGWDNTALPWLNQRQYILRNYFQYRLYHDRFAIDKSIPVMKQLYLLVVDYFYVKSLLSAYVLEKGGLTEQTVVDVMYSYHSYRQHNELAKAQFMAGIDSVKRNDDLSVLQLLV
jgi:lysine-N-methylase